MLEANTSRRAGLPGQLLTVLKLVATCTIVSASTLVITSLKLVPTAMSRRSTVPPPVRWRRSRPERALVMRTPSPEGPLNSLSEAGLIPMYAAALSISYFTTTCTSMFPFKSIGTPDPLVVQTILLILPAAAAGSPAPMLYAPLPVPYQKVPPTLLVKG